MYPGLKSVPWESSGRHWNKENRLKSTAFQPVEIR
jgi:hypothetical protein